MLGTALAILGAVGPFLPEMFKGVAGLLGGAKGGDVAGKIVDTANQVFGTSDPEKIKLAIQQDASKAQAYADKLRADTEAFRIQTEDIQSARARDLAIREVKDEKGVPAGTNTRANVMLLGVVIALLVTLIGTMLFRASIPDGVLAILNTATGSYLTMLTQAFNFEFGSSRGSSEKSNAQTNLIDKLSGTGSGK